jgi:hypothetical protein
MSIVHAHEHSDGHGGLHSHLHSHAGDSYHSGEGHSHPGQPDADMPQVGLASALLTGEGRDVTGIGLVDVIERFLRGQGVDVAAAIADLGYQREHAERAARATAERAHHIASALRKAKRKLWFEQQGFLGGTHGFSIGSVGAASERVDQLAAALAETCVNDPDLIAEAKRLAAR